MYIYLYLSLYFVYTYIYIWRITLEMPVQKQVPLQVVPATLFRYSTIAEKYQPVLAELPGIEICKNQFGIRILFLCIHTYIEYSSTHGAFKRQCYTVDRQKRST